MFNKLMKDTYKSTIGYLGKSCSNQTKEPRHRTFPNLVLIGKLHEASRFVCDRQKGGVLQPDKLAEDRTSTINETVTLVLEGKHPR